MSHDGVHVMEKEESYKLRLMTAACLPLVMKSLTLQMHYAYGSLPAHRLQIIVAGFYMKQVETGRPSKESLFGGMLQGTKVGGCSSL